MRTDGMDQVRIALKTLSQDGAIPVTAIELAAALGLDTESAKQVMRSRLHGLIDRGEAKKAGYGQFQYVPGFEPSRNGESYRRIWKLVRIQTPGWTKQSLAATSRFARDTVERYVNWLEGEGFVERHGRRGNTVLWRTTAKAQGQRDTPLPPVDLPDPYAAEKAATGRLCNLMLTRDPAQAYVKIQIQRQIAVLVARFGSQVENEETNEGDSPC